MCQRVLQAERQQQRGRGRASCRGPGRAGALEGCAEGPGTGGEQRVDTGGGARGALTWHLGCPLRDKVKGSESRS